ncbi:MAG: RNA polymerase sigma factor [Gammaproteobacteria bacterium]|nr:RNA polymerase sigma factor [Gammaproteobacteria bacterium]
MDPADALDQFLGEIQARAFRIAVLSVRDRDVALDMVQDAMIRLARNYATKPSAEWPPLFYRILQNRIRDWQRRQTLRNKVIMVPRKNTDEHDAWQPIESAPDRAAAGPQKTLQKDAAIERLNEAVGELPQRQREVFLLRAIEELSVEQTATTLDIGAGSVKTHYSRALTNLRDKLGEHWP